MILYILHFEVPEIEDQQDGDMLQQFFFKLAQLQRFKESEVRFAMYFKF